MFVGPLLDSNPTSPIQVSSPIQDSHSDGPSTPQSPPCWLTQAQSDLAHAEEELRRVQKCHATETEIVKRGVERAILGACREERRLLERVEQDHRDTQQYLEQVHRENMAAARVSQTLLDQKLHKLATLQQRIQDVSRSGLNESGSNHDSILKEIAEFLQPWEISVAYKKVNFKPSSQPNVVTFGNMCVQQQNMSLNVGGCGPHGKLCALHAQEMQCEDINHQSPRREEKGTQGQGWSSPTGGVVTRNTLSNRNNLETEEEQKLSAAKISHWLPKCDQPDWVLSQDDELESRSFQPQVEDLFLAVPSVLEKLDSKGKDQANKMNSNEKYYSTRSQKKVLSVASKIKPLPPPERGNSHFLSFNNQVGDQLKLSPEFSRRHLRYGSSALTTPRITPKDSLISQSCLDLTSKSRPYSCLSQSSDEHSLGTLGDSGRAPSSADSLDSSYTFIVSPSHDNSLNRASLNYSCRLSKSAMDLTHKTRPLISDSSNKQDLCRVKHGNFNALLSATPASPTQSRGIKTFDRSQTIIYPVYIGQNHFPQSQKNTTAVGPKQPLVARSLSLSVINGFPQEPKKDKGERGEEAFVEFEEVDPSFMVFKPRDVHFMGQFGKQGSGRSDLTLPSGIHATPQGQLFIVDCGNARIQVTDPRGNVLQQVASPNADGSARRCRNYFDIAVNAKGLIALSCAAERSLLVFSRHGRLLQTFGGSRSSSAKDELEAPRGVTVTRLDEFLVADIRKGTLNALKLDPKTGSRLERTVVTGFHRPYLVAACLSSGIVAVSERGNETGCVPCIKVLEPGWNTLRVLGVCAGMGPVLTSPWGICIDTDGNVLVADWGEQHRIVLYPKEGVGWPIVNQGLSSPRGLTLLPEGHLAVSDSMHHCIKIYQYKTPQD